MEQYKKTYCLLFNGISDIVSDMEQTALCTADETMREQLEQHILALRILQ